MKASQILYEAAEYAFVNSVGGCRAINSAYGHWRGTTSFLRVSLEEGNELYKDTLHYFKLLRPKRIYNPSVFWWADPIWTHVHGKLQPDNARVLGLLFAAAIAESEGN